MEIRGYRCKWLLPVNIITLILSQVCTWCAIPMARSELICFAAEVQTRFSTEGFYSWVLLDKDMKERGCLSWPLICRSFAATLVNIYAGWRYPRSLCANPDLSCHLFFTTQSCYIKCTHVQDWTIYLYCLFEKQVTCHLEAQFSDTALLWLSFLFQPYASHWS